MLLSPWITSVPVTIRFKHWPMEQTPRWPGEKAKNHPQGGVWGILIIEYFLHQGFLLQGIYMRNECLHTTSHSERSKQIAYFWTSLLLTFQFYPFKVPDQLTNLVLTQCNSVSQVISPSTRNGQPSMPLKVLPTEWVVMHWLSISSWCQNTIEKSMDQTHTISSPLIDHR